LKSLKSISTLKNGFFGPQNFVVFLEYKENTFFSNFEPLILQSIWNECIRFGEHVNIQVNYKILQLKVPKKAPILHNHLCEQSSPSFADETYLESMQQTHSTPFNIKIIDSRKFFQRTEKGAAPFMLFWRFTVVKGCCSR
jgi:hypothetical protein